MATCNSVQQVFSAARDEFVHDLKDPSRYDFSKFTSIDDVYDTTEQIQEEQAKTGNLRNLRKIQPYLERLQQYANVIETFVQAKPDILALIWVCTVRLLISSY